ncbi:hypothetical protein ABMY16_21500 [Vibrio vulnificus]|uniref:hypothetical protein n=1 Tax=Vibrio vulnificus TaxID=672 RepID=UPI0040593A35
MTWTGFNIDGTFKDLSHLQSKTIQTDIGGQAVFLNVSYGNHCFSDEKENGQKLPFREERYWCEERYQRSHELPEMLEDRFVESFATPYYNHRKNGEQYHYMEIHDYVIFFEITKPSNTTDRLNIKIISAYEQDGWGEVPPGKRYKVRWILSERLAGRSILKRSKRRR